VSTYDSIAWFPLCAGLTVLGLALTYIVARRRGFRSMMRGAAWSLLPLAAYLTGSIEMFWKIGTAIGDFASGFAFSPVKWTGIGVTGFAVVLFAVSGGRARRKAARDRASARAAERARKAAPAPAPAPATAPELTAGEPGSGELATRDLSQNAPRKKERVRKQPAGGAPDDDLKDIDEILRKRGI
jgi:hypothetical protein